MLKTLGLSFICKMGAKGKHSKIGYRQWINVVLSSFVYDKDYTIKEKLFAYKLGFLPQTVSLCGIDRENYFKYISQRDFLQIMPAAKKQIVG